MLLRFSAVVVLTSSYLAWSEGCGCGGIFTPRCVLRSGRAVTPPPGPIEKSQHRNGGGGVHPPAHGGGGDNGPGDGSFDYGRRLRRARLGLLLALSSISILFVTMTVVFMLLRHGSGVFDLRSGYYVRQWVPFELPVRLLLLNTFVLLASS